MSKTKPKKLRLERAEWDFSAIQEREVEACFLWECQREWPRFYVDCFNVNFAERNAFEELERATNIRGAFELWKIAIVPFEGEFVQPWQSFSSEQRESALDILNPGLREIEPSLADLDKKLLEKGIAQEKYSAAFSVNWSESDNRLLADFAMWLKRNRRYQARENRGSKTRDRLKMLGAMRLLHFYPYPEAFSITVDALGSPLYGKRPSWERARKSALEAFRSDFFIDWGAFVDPPLPARFAKFRVGTPTYTPEFVNEFANRNPKTQVLA